MSYTPRDFLRMVLEIAWRRRYLLVVPFLLMIPLAFLIQKFAPRTYVTKSLMVLMETGSNPFSRGEGGGGSSPYTFRPRVEGLKALLLSDRVLDNVMRDLLGADAPSDPRGADLWRSDFAERLSLDPVGTDFIELKLKGGDPKGMGRQLEVVVSRFLDALMPGGASLGATELLLSKRKEELTTAQRAYQDFKTRFDNSEDAARLQTLRQSSGQYAQRSRELEEVTARIDQIRRDLGSDAPSAISLDAEVNRLREGLASAGQAESADLTARLQKLLSLQAAVAQRSQLQRDVQALGRTVEGLQRSQQRLLDSERQLDSLARELDQAKTLYDSYVARYGGQLNSRSSALTFAAPERIKLVDLPVDPTVPVGTLRVYLLIGFMGSIMLGLGLTLLAEILDPKLRSYRQVPSISGLPVLARLP